MHRRRPEKRTNDFVVERGHYLLIETAGLDGGDQIAFDRLSNSADLPESMN